MMQRNVLISGIKVVANNYASSNVDNTEQCRFIILSVFNNSVVVFDAGGILDDGALAL